MAPRFVSRKIKYYYRKNANLNLSSLAGYIRPAFIFLSVLVALPIPMIWMIDVKKGQEDAIRMAGVLKRLGPDQDYLDRNGSSDVEEAEGLMQNHGGERP